MNDRPPTPESTLQNWNPLKIAGLYLLIGGLWILFSDKVALMLSPDPAMLSRISIFKGWVYMGVTALLLYWLIRRHSAGLSASEARYRSLFQNNHSVMLLIDPTSGHIVDANPSACAFYGYTHSEITGLEITAINQLNREQVFVEMERARQEQRHQFFFRHRLAGGDIREVEVYSSPIEVQGKALLYSIVHDISARKQAETRLHEMIENMAVAQSIAHFGSWEIELTGEPQRFGRQVWSDESYRIFGYEPGTLEIDFEFFVKHLHPDDRESVLQSIATALGESRDYSREYRIIRPDGAVRIIHAQAILFYNERTGQAVKVAGTMHDITERQQAEAELRESEEKYRTLLESLADGVFVAQEYRFVFVNPALPAMLGYTPEVFVGLPFEAIIAPEFLPLWTERFSQRVGSGPEPLKHYEVRFLCNGGERSLWVEVRANRIEYQGRPAVMGIIRDITERKQTQETLRENEERLRLALTATNQGLYDLNIETGEAQVSPEYATMLGYDPVTFHETHAAWMERLHPDDRQPVADNYRAYVAGEIPAYAVEFRQRTQEGDWKWILSLGKIVAWDSEGRPRRMLGIHADIHNRKRAEQQLLYQANLLQNVSDAIIATDPDFKITSWNRAAEAIYGWSAAEVMGRSTTDLFQVEYNNLQPEQVDQSFQEQGFWQGEVTQKSKSGATLQIMASVSLVRDSQGQPMGAVAVNRDITERRRAEAQLRRATSELMFMNDLLKHSTQPISVANMQGRFVRFNRAYEQLTGYQEEELLQLTYEQLTPEPWHEVEARHIATLLATGQAVRFEKEYRCKDGTVTPVELVIELYRDAHGEPLYTYGFATDITARKQAEEKIRSSEEKFSRIFQNSPVLMAMVNLKTMTLSDVNQTYCSTLGYAREEIINKPGKLGFALAQSDLKLALEILQRTDRLSGLEVTGKPKTGHEVYGLLYAEPIDIQSGHFHIISFVDITGRKQAEEKLRESESRFRAIFEQAAVGVAQIESKTGQFVQINQAYCEIVGYTQAEMLNTNFQNITHPDDLPGDLTNMELLLAGKIRLFTMEKRYFHQNGSIVWVNLTVSAMWDIDAEPDYHIAIVENITERKQAEEKLRESEERLAFALEVSQMGSWEFDLVDHTAYRSLQQARIFGYEPPLPDWTFEMFLGHIIPEDRAEAERTIGQAMAAQSDWSIECRIRRCDGEIRWIWVAGRYRNDVARDLHPMVGGVVLDITERKQAEKVLERTRNTLAQAQKIAHLGSFEYIAATQTTVWSEEEYRIYGLDPAEPSPAYDMMLQKSIHPDDAALVNEAFTKAMQSRSVYELEHRIVRPDGSVRWVYDRGHPYFDGQGELERYIGTTQDITERKQAEEARQTASRRFQMILSALYGGILVVSNDNRIEFANPAFCDMFDLDGVPEALLGLSAAEMIQKIKNTYTDPPLALARIREIVTAGQPLKGEEIAMVGGRTYLRDFIPIIIDGKEYGRLWNHLDITERKQAEEKLRASEAKFKAVFDNAPVGVSLLDAERNLLESNDMLAQIVRMNEARLVAGAYRARKYIREDGTEIPVSELASTRAIVERRAIRDVVNGIVLEDGKTIWTQISAAPLSLGDPRFVVITQDITARKLAEAELHRIMAELKRSNADLEQFAYAASHDLQEPLRGVAGMLTLLQRRYSGQLDERADEFIHHAVEGATRMQTLINDLLVLSRVGTRGKPFQPIASADALADALTNLTVAIHESGAAISYDNLPTVVADRTQMTQLFQNLIGNAIKFRGDRVPEIRVNAERQAGEWVFAVADNGIGLEAKDFERIFGVFQRLHTRREYPGTGIGLALCKKIVERHGGRIWVESQPGQGSTFYFTLPEHRTVISNQ